MATRRIAGFVLLEVMLGVMIFAVGVLALGRCVNNCLAAQGAQKDDQRARLALENRMAQIEAGEVLTEKPLEDKLEGMFAGMTLKQTRVPLNKQNEKNEDLTGLYELTLEVDWDSPDGPQAKTLSMYVLRSR